MERSSRSNSQLVREAVVMSIDRNALSRSMRQPRPRLLLPADRDGRSPDQAVPVRQPAASPTAATQAKAKALVAKAGDTGVAVNVYSEERQPARSS